MDASIDRGAPLRVVGPGRFTKVSIQTAAGEIEARLSEGGNWELHLRKEEEENWRIACRGDLEGGAINAETEKRHALVRGPLVVEPEIRIATVHGVRLELSRKEFQLLAVLAAKPDRVYTKEELLATIWGHDGTAKTRTLESHASRLRRKLKAAGADGMVVNSWGVGYRLWDRPDTVALPPLKAVDAAA
ncbi:MAG: winged helix-turn-helix domain-containing protein [Solirubrobacterales bacterium]